jgi:outer membrane protein assembly factor BamB
VTTGRLGACGAVLIVCALIASACDGHTTGASTATSAPGTGTASTPTGPAGNASAAPIPNADWTRFAFDAQRSGVGPADTGITARNVGTLRARTVHLDGTVDSSPIELAAVSVRGRSRDVVVVTTTYGRTIALDARTGGQLWEYVPPSIGGYQGSAQFTTATPVADPDRKHIYVATPDGRIRKLVLATGHEVRSARWPATITYDATHEKIAAALNLTGKYVVAVTGGYYGDAPPYQGHVVLIDRRSGRLLHVFNTLCSDRRVLIVPSSCGSSASAIWGRAGAVVEPDSGRILVATGNGPFNGRSDWGSSVLELSPDATVLLHNWTPTNQDQLSSSDTDIGSSAPAVLPAVGGRPLAVQGGKDGILRLLDLARPNGTGGGAGPRLGGELQRIATPGSGPLFSAPAVWSQGGRTLVFVADESGTGAYLLGGGARPRLSVAWNNGTPGTSPVVAGGLLYVYDQQGGRVVIYQPQSGRVLRSLPAASGHWNSPIVVGGRVIIPEGNANDHATSGTVDIYHLPGR